MRNEIDEQTMHLMIYRILDRLENTNTILERAERNNETAYAAIAEARRQKMAVLYFWPGTASDLIFAMFPYIAKVE